LQNIGGEKRSEFVSLKKSQETIKQEKRNMKSCFNQIIILALTITRRSVFAAASSLRGPSFGSSNSTSDGNSKNHDGLIVDPLLHVEHDDAPLPPSSSMIGWKLRSIRQIDTLPGGKYTQIRIIPNSKAIIVYNGMNAGGIQLVSCEDAECNNLTIPRTIHNTDPNPRYIRMELSLESSLPTLVYSAEGSTQMKLTVCLNVECTGSNGTKSIILYGQEQEQHNKITVRTNDIIILRNNNNNNNNNAQKNDQKDNFAAVVFIIFSISNPIDGCKLILAQIQITTSSTSSSIVPAPNINTNNIDVDDDVEIKIVSMMDIVTSPIPFGVNVTEGIFTAGLEFPAIIESNNNIDEKDKNGNDAHIAYWDVVNRQSVMIFNALSSKGGEQQQRQDVIVMSNTTNTSNPGSFVKVLRQPQQVISDGVLWLTFYDLILGKMYMVQCNEIKQQCMEPYIIDNNIGDRTLANYGGGGFPSTYNIVDGDDGAVQSRPTILEAYFSNNNAERAGKLKLLELTPTTAVETEITTNMHTKENTAVESKSVNNNRNEVTTTTTAATSNDLSINVIAEGKQGFGRDSSMAYYHRRHDNNNNNSNSNNNDNDLLFISLLDLQGIDTPETQVEKLAIFERISSSTQQEEENSPTKISKRQAFLLQQIIAPARENAHRHGFNKIS
jgi:hypothetical protein